MGDPPRKTFTFEEARALLPEVRERTRRAVEALSQLAIPSDGGSEANGARTERAVAETLAAWANGDLDAALREARSGPAAVALGAALPRRETGTHLCDLVLVAVE